MIASHKDEPVVRERATPDVGPRPARATKSATGSPPDDPDLAIVLAVWHELPATVRAKVIALVKARESERGDDGCVIVIACDFFEPWSRAGDLGFEASHESLGICWTHVANALLCLRMRKDHIANILNQHCGRTGNTFPYFSPATGVGYLHAGRRKLNPERLLSV